MLTLCNSTCSQYFITQNILGNHKKLLGAVQESSVVIPHNLGLFKILAGYSK